MKRILTKILILIILLFSLSVFAQENLTLTITPPLIKVNFNPGQTWQGSVKVVNNNPKDLEVFVSAMDFKSGPEGGIIFIKKKTQEDRRFLLSQWIEFQEESISIPAFQSKEIYFTIKIPQDAEPGGKYAAILVGTKPPDLAGTAIKITPLVSSLILANVRGDVKEAIWIREFSTDKIFYQRPKVNFTLKIENIGNVHIQPQGEIKILNMYGKEKGKISFNQETEYGNILPQSSRKWNFTWEGKDSLSEIGKYRAILNLTYGNELKQTEKREINFYVLPLVPLASIFGSIFVFFVLVFLGVKIYVKRAVLATLAEAKKQVGFEVEKLERKIPVLISSKEKRISDIKLKEEKEIPKLEIKEKPKIPIFLKKKFFLPVVLTGILVVLIVSVYLSGALKETKDYKIETKTEKEKISPKEVIEKIEEEKIEIEKEKEEIDKKSFSIIVLNGTGIKGLAKEVGEKLEKEGFKIEKIGNADRFNYLQTLIKYKEGKEKEAKFLNDFFGGKFKIEEEKGQKEDIILIIGKDFSL